MNDDDDYFDSIPDLRNVLFDFSRLNKSGKSDTKIGQRKTRKEPERIPKIMPITRVEEKMSPRHKAYLNLRELCKENDITLEIKYRLGYRENYLEPCFYCGEMPQLECYERNGMVRYRISHKCEHGTPRPAGTKYALSEVMSSCSLFDGLTRLLWNERQRQLKITAAYAAAHPDIYP